MYRTQYSSQHMPYLIPITRLPHPFCNPQFVKFLNKISVCKIQQNIKKTCRVCSREIKLVWYLKTITATDHIKCSRRKIIWSYQWIHGIIWLISIPMCEMNSKKIGTEGIFLSLIKSTQINLTAKSILYSERLNAFSQIQWTHQECILNTVIEQRAESFN